MFDHLHLMILVTLIAIVLVVLYLLFLYSQREAIVISALESFMGVPIGERLEGIYAARAPRANFSLAEAGGLALPAAVIIAVIAAVLVARAALSRRARKT